MSASAASPGAMLTLSVDYSEDELDALADLFGVPALGSPRLRRPPASGTAEAVLRATLATATRGLVARRAMMLTGTAIRPKVELLEPHATLLRTFLGAETIVTVERVTPTETDRWVVFVRGDVVVEQRAMSGRAILRMTAHPVAALDALVVERVDLDAADPAPGAARLELSVRSLDAAPGDLPQTAAPAVRELLYARRQEVRVVVARRDGEKIERRSLEWLEAGSLGLWRIERDDAGATATAEPVTQDDARAELEDAYRARTAAG